MKIEINGFTIELNTDDVNMTLKVADATGKELSNNTFSQESSEESSQVEMPPVEETEPNAEPAVTDVDPDTATEEEIQKESFLPTFENFKKLIKNGKIK